MLVIKVTGVSKGSLAQTLLQHRDGIFAALWWQLRLKFCKTIFSVSSKDELFIKLDLKMYLKLRNTPCLYLSHSIIFTSLEKGSFGSFSGVEHNWLSILFSISRDRRELNSIYPGKSFSQPSMCARNEISIEDAPPVNVETEGFRSIVCHLEKFRWKYLIDLGLCAAFCKFVY